MLSIDGLALDDPAGRWSIDSDTSLRSPGEISTTLVRLPGRDGVAAIGNTVIGPSSRVIVMQVNGSDYPSMMANRAILDRAFTRRGSALILREQPSGQPMVEAECRLASVKATDYGVADLSSTLVAYTLTIPAGIYRGDPVSAPLPAGTTVIAALTGGSARQPAPTIAVNPTAVGPVQARITAADDPLAWVHLSATVNSTSPVTIHTNPLRATQAGVEVSGWVDAGPHPLHVPADGRLSVSLVNATAQITSRKAWY